MAKLEGSDIEIAEYTIIPDEQDQIVGLTRKHVAQKIDMIIFTGETGMSPGDVTPEALRPMLDREIPGIEETMRSYGQNRTHYSMLSRSVSGQIEDSLVLALPGSTNGAKESMVAIFPPVFHIFRVMEAARYDEL